MLPFLAALCAGQLAACSDDDDDDHDHRVEEDAGKSDAGKADGGSADCVKSPKTSTEILNACTDAEKIDKPSKPPLLLPDGGVPPLEGQ